MISFVPRSTPLESHPPPILGSLRSLEEEIQSSKPLSRKTSHHHETSADSTRSPMTGIVTGETSKSLEHDWKSQAPILPLAETTYSSEQSSSCHSAAGCNQLFTDASTLIRIISHLTSTSGNDSIAELTDHVSTSVAFALGVETGRTDRSAPTSAEHLDSQTLTKLLPATGSEYRTQWTAAVSEITWSEHTTKEDLTALSSMSLPTTYGWPLISGTQEMKHDHSVGWIMTELTSVSRANQSTRSGLDSNPQTTEQYLGLHPQDLTMENTQASRSLSARGWQLMLGTISGASLGFVCIFYLQRLCYANIRKSKHTRMFDHDRYHDGESTVQPISRSRNLEVSRFSADSQTFH